MQPIVRVAGVLVEDDKILLVEQKVTARRRWAQPGGKVELGETLEQALVREMKEETGLDVAVDELLYVSDRIMDDAHVVLISFLVTRKAGTLGTGHGTEFSRGKIASVKMVPISELPELGFSASYCALAKTGFPRRGTYIGDLFYREETP